MEKYELAQLKHAKESGARARKNKEKERRPFFRLTSVVSAGLQNNPYNGRTGNLGKRLKAAWHNAYIEQDKLSA